MNPRNPRALAALTLIGLALVPGPWGCGRSESPAGAALPETSWEGDAGQPRRFDSSLILTVTIPTLTTTGVYLPTGGDIAEVNIHTAPLFDPAWCGSEFPGAAWADPAFNSIHAGIEFEGLAEWGAAGGAYKLAVQQSPRLIPAWERFANALARLGHLDQAQAAFRNAVAIDPAYSLGQVNLARLMERAGRAVDAEASYERGIAAAPRYLPNYLQYARFLAAQGRDRRVLGVLDRATREARGDESAAVLDARAAIHDRLGEAAVADSLRSRAEALRGGRASR